MLKRDKIIVMEQEQVSWDYKKIVVGVLVLGILGWVGYQMTQPAQKVAGVQTVKPERTQMKVAAPQIDIQRKITDITEQISQLDMQEVAASSPQVQKVLKDMEGLKDLPKNEAKNACMQICSSL